MEKKCARCENTFTTKRSDSLYCSRTCRQYAYLDNRFAKSGGRNIEIKQDTYSHSNNSCLIKNALTGFMEIWLLPDNYVAADQNENDENKENKPRTYRRINSYFIESMGNFEGDDEERDLASCIQYSWDSPNDWVAVRLKCLIECILLFSEAKTVRAGNVMEVYNALTGIMESSHFQNLSSSFPYKTFMSSLKIRLYNICCKVTETERICLKIKRKDRIDIIKMRFTLSQHVPKIRFSELDFWE